MQIYVYYSVLIKYYNESLRRRNMLFCNHDICIVLIAESKQPLESLLCALFRDLPPKEIFSVANRY